MSDPKHPYQACRDRDCPRPWCRIYREGYADGFQDGEADGFAAGQRAASEAGK